MSKLNLGDSLILDSDYSTTEKKTGATWIDGKPIYRKVFSLTSPPNSTATLTPHNIDNFDKLIRSDCHFYASGNSHPIPWDANSSPCYYYFTSTSIGLSFTYWFNSPIYLIAEYTKTTD